MSKVAQLGDFFVVGGPVQPDRPCYVERAADAELARGIREQRFCSVLAPRASGKSSLMARAIRALRQERQLAAVVDLAQLGLRGNTGNAGDVGRWYYGIAYRILRELRLKIDLQAWWQEKSSLSGEQRLGEFFWEIVLANTSVPVTVFFDEAERSLDVPSGTELFAAIRACYARRVSEPDYSRLNFVVLGVASSASLAPDPSVSPFIDGQHIDLADFTLAECRELAPGLRIAEAEAGALVERIYGWTRGQPYMTQKVARGVARKGGRVEDVDRVVREQFLSTGGPQAEPLLNHVRSVLGDGRPTTRQALTLLGKIARGGAVHYESGAPARELLRLSGVAAVGPDGLLRYRNRIFAEAFDGRWLSSARPFDWRGKGAAAALLAVAIAVPIWYGRYLPRPYVRTLSVVTQDAAVAEDAYEKLHRLPGFSALADRLMAEAMARRSRAAQSYTDVMAADGILRELPDSAALADELQADYWLRRAKDATHAGRRDGALLFSVRAAQSGGAEARRVAAELIGNDYRRLVVSYRLANAPSDWGIDWSGRRLTVVDAAHRALRVELEARMQPPESEPGIESSGREPQARSDDREPLLRSDGDGPLVRSDGDKLLVRSDGDEAPVRSDSGKPAQARSDDRESDVPSDGGDRGVPPDRREPAQADGRLTALQHVPVTRELSVDDKGSAGAFRLLLRIQSAGANDLLVTLTAPSGASVSLPLVEQSPGQELYSFSATGASPLAQLSDEARQGVWRFAVVDRAPGGVGVLVRWGLRFSDAGPAWRDSPEQGIAIPDPVRTDQVRVTLSPDGRRAVAETARAGAVGELALWDLASGKLMHDLHVQAVPDRLQFNADGSRLLVQTGGRLTIWDVESGNAVAKLATQSEFLLPAALSLDGDFLIIAERVEGARPLFSLVRVADGALVASSAGIAAAKDWVLGPQARYLALIETSRVVAVFDPRRGRVLRELRHEHDVSRIVAMPAGDLLITVDAVGNVRAWPLPVDGSATAADSWRLGVTVDPSSVSVSGDGSTAAFEGSDGRIVVRDVGGDLKPVYLRVDRNDPPLATGLSPDGSALVTVNGKVLRVWRLDDRELGGGADLNLSALALDGDGSLAVLGFRAGHVRVRSAAELARAVPSEAVDYIGHRGAVTSLDVNVPQNLIVSGGEDGVVRVWDLATVAPAPEFMRHPIGPVHAVCLSGDGRWLASAADYSARAWRVSDGKLTAELPVNGTALAVDIAPDSMHWAASDSAGNVFFGTAEGTAPLGSVRAQGPVAAIAFAPGGRLLASGDETGTVEVWDTQRFEAAGRRQGFPYPVRWLDWSADGRYLLIQTDQWLHRAEFVNGELRVVDSRLLDVGVEAGAAVEADDGQRLRLIGGRSAGRLALLDLDLAAPIAADLPADSPLLARDWSAVLGLRIDENGEIR